jgi:hypothetical protein
VRGEGEISLWAFNGDAVGCYVLIIGSKEKMHIVAVPAQQASIITSQSSAADNSNFHIQGCGMNDVPQKEKRGLDDSKRPLN